MEQRELSPVDQLYQTPSAQLSLFQPFYFFYFFSAVALEKRIKKIINRYYTMLTHFPKLCGYFISKAMHETLR